MTNAKEFKVALMRNGITMTQLSEMVHITLATLSRKVNNLSEFTVSEVKTISDILNLSVDDRERIFFANNVE